MTARWEMDLFSGNPDFAPSLNGMPLNSIICYLTFLRITCEHLLYVFIQPLPRSFHGRLVIEGNLKRPSPLLAVVVDADILNADAPGSQDDGYAGNGAHLIAYIHGELIGWLAGGLVCNGIAVITGGLKQPVDILSLMLPDFLQHLI